MTIKYRNYNIQKVDDTYKDIFKNQRIKIVNEMRIKYDFLEPKAYTIWEVFKKLETVRDESDPDTDLPQIVHAWQTAESIKSRYMEEPPALSKIHICDLFTRLEWNKLAEDVRIKYNTTLDKFYEGIEEWDWFPLIGLIHDLGKVMVETEFGGLPQWLVVGDIFPLGILLSKEAIFYERGFHLENPDFNTNLYAEHCGFNNIMFTWSHDQYMAMVLEKNETLLPKEAIYIVRYHSFYSWHTPKEGQNRGYLEYANKEDWRMLPLLKAFQKADLYSKTRDVPDSENIKKEYDLLIKKYFKEKLIW
jgi:inositol oxygenase